MAGSGARQLSECNQHAVSAIPYGLVADYALVRVVVECSDAEIVGASDNPRLSGHKLGCAHWKLARLECAHNGLC